MPLALLIANTNRAIDPEDSDVLDVQQNVVPQELFGVRCTPQGFLVLPKVVRVGPDSSLWTRSGTWSSVAGSGIIENTNERASGTTNDFIEITIRGRAFRLIFLGSTDRGIANITIDGLSPSAIGGVTDEGGGTAQDTVDTYLATTTHRIFVGYKGLSNAAHTIRITVSGTKNAASTGFTIGSYGIEYVDALYDAADGVACNQVLVLPYGDRQDLVDPGDTAAITYVGSWSTVNNVDHLMGRRRESTTGGDYFEITFTGTGIVLLFLGQNAGGFLDITVDAALVAKRWTTYFPANSHFNYPFQVLGLAPGSHTVRVTVNAANENGGDNAVAFAGFFVVKDADDANGYGGVLISGERRWNKTGLDTVTLAAPNASNPRKDLLVVNKSGVFSIIQGTAAATPAEPAEPTDDRVPLAVLTQDKSGVLLQRLHAPGLTTVSENEDAVLRYVQDRRRGIVSALGEVPLGVLTSQQAATQQSLPPTRFRLPNRAKRVRVRKFGGAAGDRVALKVSGASPELRREFDDSAVPVEGWINVDGWGGKVVHGELISSGEGTAFELQSVT